MTGDLRRSDHRAHAKAVGLFETAPEPKRLLGWSRRQGTGLTLVALSPEASWAAESRGLRYQTIEDLCRYSEPQLSDYFLCYGEGVCDEARRVLSESARQANVSLSQPVPVGSAALDRLCAQHRQPAGGRRARRAGRGRTAMYIPTVLIGDHRYFSRHMFPDIWCWRLQRDIMQLYNRFPDVQLLVKPYPNDLVRNPVTDWIRRAVHVLRRVANRSGSSLATPLPMRVVAPGIPDEVLRRS